MTDLVYNPSCYTAPVVDLLKEVLRIYIMFNLVVAKTAILAVQNYWFHALSSISIGFTGFSLANWLIPEFPEQPLTDLQYEIVRCIHLNASTGYTTQMIYEQVNEIFAGQFAGAPVRLADVKNALNYLKGKGYILSTQATLWLVSGK
jgi:hypothetical protein